MPTFSSASESKLKFCHPKLQEILREAIEIVDFTIITSHRGKDEQEKAFAEGKSKVHFPHGKHNSLPSRAVDIWPWTPTGKLDWKDKVAGGRLMGIIQAIAWQKKIGLRFGFDWDGDFRTVDVDPDENFLDGPHVELATGEE